MNYFLIGVFLVIGIVGAFLFGAWIGMSAVTDECKRYESYHISTLSMTCKVTENH